MKALPICSQVEWVRRFTFCLRSLQPDVDEVRATHIAITAFPSASDIEPEEAAAVFAEVLEASAPHAPPPLTSPGSVPPSTPYSVAPNLVRPRDRPSRTAA